MIVVTTPTGHIGSQVLDQLLSSKKKVRVLARDPSKISSASGLEVVRGALDDKASVMEAYKNAETLFFVVPPSQTYMNADEYYAHFGATTCEAIDACGIKRVVYISGTGLGVDRGAGPVYSSFPVERMIEATKAHMRVLHCGTFMENLVHAVPQIKAMNRFGATVLPDAKLPWVATKDIAMAAVRLLLDDTWTGKSSIGVLGPEDLSYAEIAKVMSTVLDRNIQYMQIDPDAFKATLVKYGTSPAAADGLVGIYNSMNAGTFNQVKRTSESSSPTSFREWCETTLKTLVANSH